MANYSEGSARMAWTEIADDAYLDVRPDAYALGNSNPEEWRILSLSFGDDVDVEIYHTDGANEDMLFEVAGGYMSGLQFMATRDLYYRVKNVSGASKYIGYNCVVTKERN